MKIEYIKKFINSHAVGYVKTILLGHIREMEFYKVPQQKFDALFNDMVNSFIANVYDREFYLFEYSEA